MHSRVATLLALALLTIGLSGCMGGDGGTASISKGPVPSESQAPEPPASTSPSPPPVLPSNAAPELNVKILRNGTAILPDNGSYPVPALENLTFDASGSRDPDGDDLSFTWDFGDGAASTQATALHAYAAAGNRTVTVKVSDGDLSDIASLRLTVAPAGPLRVDNKTFTGKLLVGTQDPAVAAQPCGAAAQEDVDQKTFDWTLVDKETDGTASVVTHVLVRLEGQGETTLNIDLRLLDAAGKELGRGATDGPDETVELSDVRLGAGVYKIRVVGCNLANIEFTVQASAEYWPA